MVTRKSKVLRNCHKQVITVRKQPQWPHHRLPNIPAASKKAVSITVASSLVLYGLLFFAFLFFSVRQQRLRVALHSTCEFSSLTSMNWMPSTVTMSWIRPAISRRKESMDKRNLVAAICFGAELRDTVLRGRCHGRWEGACCCFRTAINVFAAW